MGKQPIRELRRPSPPGGIRNDTPRIGVAIRFTLALSLAACATTTAPPRPAPTDSTVRVAGIVLKWIRGDKPANFARIVPMIRAAAAGGAKIVCSTECFLDGYAIHDKSIPLETYRALGEPIPAGEYFQKLTALADELDIYLIAGLLEAKGDARYNTAVVIDPDGRLIGKYHKQKLGHEKVRNFAGSESLVHTTTHGNLGIMICADRRDPAVVEGFCVNGADFLFCPSGGMFGSRRNDPIVQARSRENRKHIVFVHPAEFLVTGPTGEILSRSIVGDRLAIDPEMAYGPLDQKGVFYFDLPR